MTNNLLKTLLFFIFISGIVNASVCSGGAGTWWLIYGIVGVFIMGAVIIIIYMLSKSTNSVSSNVWAKIELGELGVSLILVLVAFSIVSFACEMDTTFITALTTGTEVGTTSNLYDGAMDYIYSAKVYCYNLMVMFRYNLGVAEIRQSQNVWKLKSIMFGGGISESFPLFAGEQPLIGMFSTGLNLGTMYYLNMAFMEYLLLYFWESDVFLLLFPLGIILRTIPIIRKFGGALIAISLGIFILLPFTLVLNGVLFGTMLETSSGGCPPSGVEDDLNCIINGTSSPHDHCTSEGTYCFNGVEYPGHDGGCIGSFRPGIDCMVPSEFGSGLYYINNGDVYQNSITVGGITETFAYGCYMGTAFESSYFINESSIPSAGTDDCSSGTIEDDGVCILSYGECMNHLECDGDEFCIAGNYIGSGAHYCGGGNCTTPDGDIVSNGACSSETLQRYCTYSRLVSGEGYCYPPTYHDCESDSSTLAHGECSGDGFYCYDGIMVPTSFGMINGLDEGPHRMNPYLSPGYNPGLGVIDLFVLGATPNLGLMINYSARGFIASILLTAINFILIVSFVKDLSIILGEPIDVSRLSRMI